MSVVSTNQRYAFNRVPTTASGCCWVRFRPDGRVTFGAKSNQNLCAGVRPPLRGGSFAPAPWGGHAPTGHPWPNGARSASMPSDPPHGTSTQPPDAHFASSVKLRQESKKQICLADFSSMTSLLPDSQAAFDSGGMRKIYERHTLRLVAGRAQVLRSGQPGMDAGLAAPGHGWPIAAAHGAMPE
ncbi:Uncharacterised protein [Paucimonas lemoignei]|nr:Uncharacterised protein [Paucimonas lemoignei]